VAASTAEYPIAAGGLAMSAAVPSHVRGFAAIIFQGRPSEWLVGFFYNLIVAAWLCWMLF